LSLEREGGDRVLIFLISTTTKYITIRIGYKRAPSKKNDKNSEKGSNDFNVPLSRKTDWVKYVKRYYRFIPDILIAKLFCKIPLTS